ncbi:MAG: hypothetical protein M3Z04_11345 [Chloroflexota bacterium]|nr:hypothetical protein [Chloroflexota bacterium]
MALPLTRRVAADPLAAALATATRTDVGTIRVSVVHSGTVCRVGATVGLRVRRTAVRGYTRRLTYRPADRPPTEQ